MAKKSLQNVNVRGEIIFVDFSFLKEYLEYSVSSFGGIEYDTGRFSFVLSRKQPAYPT